MAACGSKWSGVALSAKPVTAVPSVRDAKKSEVRHNPTALHLRGSIGVDVVVCGVLRFLKVHFLKSVLTAPIKPLKFPMPVSCTMAKRRSANRSGNV